MADLVIRDHVRALVKPLLPRRWRWVNTQKPIDDPAVTTVMLKQSAIRRAYSANGNVIPGARRAVLVLTVVVPETDTEFAEHRMDDEVVTLLNAIDSAPGLAWSEASKRIFSEALQWPCYDIDIEFPYHHETEG